MTGRTRAFTLIETLLALGLVVALCAAVFSFLLSLGERREGVEKEGQRRHALSTVLSRLSADLATAISGDARLGAGVKGTQTSVVLLTRSVDLDAALRGAPEGVADLLACEYRLEAGALLVSRRAVIADETTETRAQAACDGVRRLQLRYFDGRVWADSFDSAAAGGLPRAVEVRVWTGNPVREGEEPRGEPDEALVVAIPDSAGGAP